MIRLGFSFVCGWFAARASAAAFGGPYSCVGYGAKQLAPQRSPLFGPVRHQWERNMNTTTASVGFWFRFTQAPLILRAYLVFAVFASVLSFSVFYAPPLYEASGPYTGWSGLTNYLFTLFFATSAIQTRDRKPIYGVAMLLGLFAIFGVIGIYWHTWGPDAGRSDFGNPYLVYHPWRPVFTVALPVAWLLLLISSTMRKPKKSLDRGDGPTHGEPQ